jgi:hypothetical protein
MNKKFNNYFPHECNPRNNRDLKALFTQYKAEGYGYWWILQEILSVQPNYKLDISDEYAYNELADDMRCDVGYLEGFINDCVNKFHLLECDEQYLWSPQLVVYMQPLEERRARQSEGGKKGSAITNAKKKSGKLNESVELVASNLEDFSTKKSKEEKSKEEYNTPSEDSNISSATVIPITPRNDGLMDIDLLLKRVIADDIHFCVYFIRPGCLENKEQLNTWLHAFNKWLRYGGEHIRNEHAYRLHFKNWLARQDLRKDPARYDPVTDTTTTLKPRMSIPLEMKRKTAAEVLAEQRREEEEMLRKLKAK